MITNDLSDSLGVPVEELPRSINSSKELLDDFNLAIKDRVLMLKRVNENYNVKITDLEEYRRNRPLIETLKANNLELEKAKKRIFDLPLIACFDMPVDFLFSAGGGFLFGAIAGYAIKKVLSPVAAVVVGLFLPLVNSSYSLNDRV